MKKAVTLALAAGTLAASTFACAEKVGDFDVSMNVGLASDYMFRGVSQTQNKGAIQGGLDVVHSTGLYVGTWGSNVDFAAGDASVEMDYYAGYRTSLGDVSLDLGYLQYTYPDESAIDFGETYAKLGYMGVALEVYYSSNSNVSAMQGDDAALYTKLGYSYSFENGISLGASVGRYDLKDEVFVDADGSDRSSYIDWSLSASKEFAGIKFGLTYTDTDLDQDEGVGFGYGTENGGDDTFDSSITLSASKAL